MGMSNKEIYRYQWILRNQGYALTVDGLNGPGTRAAVSAFQQKVGLSTDGLLGPNTNAALSSLQPLDRYLSLEKVTEAANALSATPAHVLSVMSVETDTRKVGFISNGFPILRFERHYFYRLLKAAGQDADSIKAQFPDICNDVRGGYLGGEAEYGRLQKAIAVHKDAALQSASYGLFQIMGSNYRLAGKNSAQELVDSFTANEGEHLKGFVSFVTNNPILRSALAANDWATFAKGYNGAGYLANQYDTKLAHAFSLYQAYV